LENTGKWKTENDLLAMAQKTEQQVL
jgi:hypothetical protein